MSYRGSRHPGHGYSVDDHPVIVRQRSHVWVGSASGVVVRLRREDRGLAFQIRIHRRGLWEHKETSTTR